MEDKKYLVAYFSHTGTTEKEAKRIADLAGADLFKIETLRDYSKRFPICAVQAGKEKMQNARPALKRIRPKDGLKDYTDIILGYPAWCFSCPMAIFTFLEENNLEGKTIHPFDTSMGSGPLGTDEIRESTNAEVVDCVDVGKLSDEEIKEWLNID